MNISNIIVETEITRLCHVDACSLAGEITGTPPGWLSAQTGTSLYM